MRSKDYGPDALSAFCRRRAATVAVPAEQYLVVEDLATRFCGAVVEVDKDRVTLEDRFGRRRVFPLSPGGFGLDGRPVTLVRPRVVPAVSRPTRTASGSVAVAGMRARIARQSRLYVEGIHDAALIERVWGDDLRIEGLVVEPLDGVDALPGIVRAFDPGFGRRLGVLVDHLVAGSKESRIAATVSSPQVLVTGHPYVDIWQAVKPSALGISAWPRVQPGQPWKEGVCHALGVAEPIEMWRRVLAAVSTYTDLEVPLLTAVERLIDFVTEPN